MSFDARFTIISRNLKNFAAKLQPRCVLRLFFNFVEFNALFKTILTAKGGDENHAFVNPLKNIDYEYDKCFTSVSSCPITRPSSSRWNQALQTN